MNGGGAVHRPSGERRGQVIPGKGSGIPTSIETSLAANFTVRGHMSVTALLAAR